MTVRAVQLGSISCVGVVLVAVLSAAAGGIGGHEPSDRLSSVDAPRASPAPVPTTARVVVPPSSSSSPPPPAVTTDCADALAYLAAHQAPGFVDVCGAGSALGHDGYTCWNTAGVCPDGGKVIHIACPAPFVYMNEAHNSWSLQGLRRGIDPYGQGSPAERAYCNQFR